MIMELPQGECLAAHLGEGLVLVDFVMNSCGHCVKLEKTLRIMDFEIPDLRIIKVRKELHPEETRRHGVQGYPTVFFYKDGQPVDKIIGSKPLEQFYPVLQQYLY